MKKLKRILAIITIVILVLMYVSTLFFAIFDNSSTMWMFKASIACTVILPVLLYAFNLVYRVTRPDDPSEYDPEGHIPSEQDPSESDSSGENSRTDDSNSR